MRPVVVVGVSVVVLGSGCRVQGPHPIYLCEDFLASLDCGEFDFTAVFPDDFCDPFDPRETIGCNVSDYFVCLTDGAECVPETSTYTPPLCLPPPCVFGG